MSKRTPGFPPEGEPLPRVVVDNHTHYPLTDPGDLPDGVAPLAMAEQMTRAERAGVVASLHSACEYPDFAPALAMVRQWPTIALAVAIHPNEAPLHADITDVAPDGWTRQLEAHHRELSLDDALAHVAELGALPEVVAVGETGLDFYRTAERGRAVQRESFRAHIALAKELGKPLQIHDRDAHADVIETLLADGAPEITVFHCYSGDREMARLLSENGWYASFAGSVTFRANDELRYALAFMDRSRILVETDAPYLTPAPMRGRLNAPYVMAHTVRSMAITLGLDLAETCDLLYRNTASAYGAWWT